MRSCWVVDDGVKGRERRDGAYSGWAGEAGSKHPSQGEGPRGEVNQAERVVLACASLWSTKRGDMV